MGEIDLKIKYTTLTTVIYLCMVPIIFATGFFVPSGISRRLLIGIVLWILILISSLKKGYTWKDSILLLFVVCTIFGLTYITHKEYAAVYQERVFSHVLSGVTGISGYFLIRQNRDEESFYHALKISGYILFAYYFYRSFDVIRNGYWTVFSTGTASNVYNNSSMEFGYSMLFPALIFLYFFLKERKKAYIFISLVGLAEIILYGGRGPILAYCCYVAFYFIFVWFRNREIPNKPIKILGIILVLILVYFLFDTLLSVSVNVLESHGIRSRALTYLINGEATADNGRTIIAGWAIDLISKKSVFSGYGPLADIALMGLYSHNIILELMIDFGVVWGSIVFVTICLAIIVTIFKEQNLNRLMIFFIFVCCGFVKLFVSNSFWVETFFWMMLGLMVNYREYRKFNTVEGE